MVRIAIAVAGFLLPVFISAQSLAWKETVQTWLTTSITNAGPIPTAYDPNGVYPYISYVETSNRPNPKDYKIVTIENSKIAASICPDLGGKLVSLIHKGSNREVLYKPGVVRHTRILPRFYFTAGGIEISFPISHSPSQNENLPYRVEKVADRIYISCGERELRFGMQYIIEFSLGEKDDFLTQRVIYHNPGTQSYPWMSWSNAALPSAADTRFDFPTGRVLRHASTVDTIDWEKQGPKVEADIMEMTGYFWQTKFVNAFGAFTPSLGTGLYHIADESIAPGVKLWSYGLGEDSAWSTLSTLKHQPYIEIQGGPLGDQSIKTELASKQTKWHVEYWYPTDKAMDIHQTKTPVVDLRKINSGSFFSWADTIKLSVWLQMVSAQKNKSPVPPPPQVTSNNWAPSGMENLDAAFQFAIRNSNKNRADLWRLYYGAWLAGRDRKDAAIRELAATKHGIAKVLLARIQRMDKKNPEALNSILSIEEPWLQNHPQVVVERDKILRAAGSNTIPERERWLGFVEALEDEQLIERRIQLLIDKEQIPQAKKLLIETRWQKVHQSYTRTGLWEQICRKEGKGILAVPTQLGEDRLARFGAYREYE